MWVGGQGCVLVNFYWILTHFVLIVVDDSA
jgi:hypothetical protein